MQNPAGAPHQTQDSETDRVKILLRKAIMELTSERGASKSICPSEAARLCNTWLNGEQDDWRKLMAATRQQATFLALQGNIDILRKGKVFPPEEIIKGVIRLRLKATPDLS